MRASKLLQLPLKPGRLMRRWTHSKERGSWEASRFEISRRKQPWQNLCVGYYTNTCANVDFEVVVYQNHRRMGRVGQQAAFGSLEAEDDSVF